MRPSRSNPGEPRPKVGAPSCPDHLDPVARAEWTRMVPLLLELRLLAEGDRAILAAYCVAWSRWQKAETEIAAKGEVFTTPAGFIQKSPWVGIAHEAMKLVERLGAHFGASPATRSKVTAAPQDPPRARMEAILGGKA